MRHRTVMALAPTSSIGARTVALATALVTGPFISTALAAQAPNPVAIKVTADAAAVAPDSSFRGATEVRAVGRRYASTIRHCYNEQGLKVDPALRALLRVELMVLPTGLVQNATASATDVNGEGMAAVLACVSTAVRAWRFSDGAPQMERVVLEFDLLPPSP